MTVLWWAILVASVILFLGILCFILPRQLFKVGHKASLENCRGMRNYKESDGRTIVYEPLKENKKYVNQYLISERNNKKVIMCKIDTRIKYLDYDIVLFNSSNSVLKVINVKEKIEKKGFTKTLTIPKKTSYASVNVKVANATFVSENTPFELSNKAMLLYAVVSLFISLAEVFLVNVSLASIYSDIFFTSYIKSSYSIIYITIFGFIVALLSTFITLTYLRKKYSKGGSVTHYEV